MTSIDAASRIALGLRARIDREGWIQSPTFDTFLMILVPLATLPILAGLYFRIPLLAVGGGLTLAFSHYFSTIAFYFWDENREYHRTRWLAFYAGPIAIVLVYSLLLGLDIPYIIQFVLFFWNTFHVARQNCGILSIYRARSGISDLQQKHVANRAIIAVSTFLALWNIETHREVSALFGMVSADFGALVRIVAGVVAAVAVAHLLLTLARREATIGLPEGMFLAASLVFFWPYLFIRDSGNATYAMLLPHYVQYMALVWLLHRRKFGPASVGAPPPLLRMSAKLSTLIPVLFAVGCSFYLFYEFTKSHGYEWHFESLYLLIALLHFYLDGLIWSFRRPHVRQTILPFLLRHPQRQPM